MLVLSRKLGEAIVMTVNGAEITVTVVKAHNGTVRLGIEAPKDVPVHRAEVLEAIKAKANNGN